MYLTDKHNGRQRLVEDHQTAELLLEFYERRLDETNESSVRLQSLLADIDNNIALVLQSTRVRLQNLELQSEPSSFFFHPRHDRRALLAGSQALVVLIQHRADLDSNVYL